MNNVIGKVYETKDYNKFSFVEGNRPIKTKTAQWKALVASIDEYGQLEPALVTKRFEIINGQHRLMACKKLGKPFKYIIETTPGGVSAAHIGAANSAKNWGIKEYVHFYASQNDIRSISYRYLEALNKEFKLSYDVLCNVIYTNNGGFAKRQIIDGLFSMNDISYTVIRECLTSLYSLKFNELQKEAKLQARPYWEAVTYVYRCPVNLKRLATKCFENIHRIPSTSRTVELLRVFSEIYNKGLSKDKKIYLDTDYSKGTYRKWE